jgi:hypothetical protein
MTVYVDGVDLAYYYFHYSPSHALAFVAIAVFAVLFILLTARVLLTRSPRFILLLPFTAAIEIVGFALRYVCSENPTTGVFTGMSVLLLISANIMALVSYKAVGDVIRLSGVENRYFIIGPNFTKQFYKTALLASILQVVGSGMTGSASSNNTGFTIAIVGVVLQMIFLAAFMLVIHYVNNCPDYQYFMNGKNTMKKLMSVMYATTGLLFVRSGYRLASYIISFDFPSEIHEWTYYAFDPLLIAICFVIHFAWFIGGYLPHSNMEFDPKAANHNYVMSNMQNQPPAADAYYLPQQRQQNFNPAAGYNNA